MSKQTMTRLIGVWVIVMAVVAFGAINAAPAQDYGVNWTVEYFNNTTLSGTPLVVEAAPNGVRFDWGLNAPNPAIPADNWSARFTSSQNFNQGTYNFVMTSDDGARVFIDNVPVFDQFGPRPLTTYQFTVNLTAGVHQLRVEYLDTVDAAYIDFQWFLISGGVPTPIIINTAPPPVTAGPSPTAPPPTRTPLPAIPPGALTGTIVRAQVLLVRGAPFLGAPVVGRVLRGQTYAVVGRDQDARWFLIQLSSGQGWVWGYYINVNGNEFNAPVASSFVTAGNPAALSGVVVQTQDTLRLRAAPTTDSEQIGRVPWGDILPVIGRTGNNLWYQVVFRGTTGWIASEFVVPIEGDLNTIPVTG
jgi:hypothetical protein